MYNSKLLILNESTDDDFFNGNYDSCSVSTLLPSFAGFMSRNDEFSLSDNTIVTVNGMLNYAYPLMSDDTFFELELCFSLNALPKVLSGNEMWRFLPNIKGDINIAFVW